VTVDKRDIMEAGRKVSEKQKSNALFKNSVWAEFGMISTRTGHSHRHEATPRLAQFPN
jgi:hypothetical protein